MTLKCIFIYDLERQGSDQQLISPAVISLVANGKKKKEKRRQVQGQEENSEPHALIMAHFRWYRLVSHFNHLPQLDLLVPSARQHLVDFCCTLMERAQSATLPHPPVLFSAASDGHRARVRSGPGLSRSPDGSLLRWCKQLLTPELFIFHNSTSWSVPLFMKQHHVILF